jgi:hypothetical protein
MFNNRSSFGDSVKSFFRRAGSGLNELNFLGQSYVLVIFRRNGTLLYRMNAGIAVLILAIADIISPSLVILAILMVFICGLRWRFQRGY